MIRGVRRGICIEFWCAVFGVGGRGGDGEWVGVGLGISWDLIFDLLWGCK